MPEQHVDELLPAYALGSLDEEERLSVSKHLDECKICEQELRAYQNVVNSIPLGLQEINPSPTLKQKIMQQVETQKAQPMDAPVVATPERSRWESITNLFRRSAPAWGLASLALVLILGVSNFFLWQRIQNLGQQHPAAILLVTLRGDDDTSQAEGVLVLDQEGLKGTLVVDGLNPLGEANQYQLWLIEGERRTSGGVFSVSDDGYGRLYVSLPKPLSVYTGFGITIEPTGGSPGPTGIRVLGVDL